MALQPERKKELDDALLDALLRESYVTLPHDAPRINRLLSQLDETSSGNDRSKTARVSSASSSGNSFWNRIATRWVSFAAAVVVLLAVGYAVTYMTTSNAAYAAVIRSLETTPATRAYRMRMVHQRPVWGNREVVSELYLNDRDQFVVRHPGWQRFADVWIGGDSKSRWIAPRFGPAFTGGEETLGGWLTRKDIPSPYLHVSTVLERMSRGYKLDLLDNESIAHADAPEISSECQHIRGKLRYSHRMLPTQIELWADVDTGMARRLELTWQRAPSERGPVSWTIELMGSPSLPDNWFELEGHISPDRKVVPIQSTAELDAVESQTKVDEVKENESNELSN